MDSNVCRICLEKSRRLKSIFENETSFDVPTFINKFCNVLISVNDEFTKKICRKCLDKIKMSHDLRAKCIESDRKLRSRVEHSATELGLHLTSSLSATEAIKTECIESLDVCPSIYDEDNPGLNLSMSQSFESFTNFCESTLQEQLTTSPTEENLNKETNEISENDNSESKTQRAKKQKKTHMCSVCGKIFFTAGHLRSHELTHNNSKDFTCHSCGKKFLTKSYLNRHMKSHLNERSYRCKVCQKGFNTSTSLGYHFRLVHSGETNFFCTFCSKGFPLKIQLISHTRSHSGEKPHKCNQCEKKYSHKIDLKRHMMLHTGNKPYKCPYCERTFTKKSNMECHIPTHTGEKPYKCGICFKEFRQPCPYKKHLQSHLKPNSDQTNSKTKSLPS